MFFHDDRLLAEVSCRGQYSFDMQPASNDLNDKVHIQCTVWFSFIAVYKVTLKGVTVFRPFSSSSLLHTRASEQGRFFFVVLAPHKRVFFVLAPHKRGVCAVSVLGVFKIWSVIAPVQKLQAGPSKQTTVQKCELLLLLLLLLMVPCHRVHDDDDLLFVLAEIINTLLLYTRLGAP